MSDESDELLLELGDLARERLWNKPTCPKSMDRVYKAEDSLATIQAAAQKIQDQMAEQEQAYTEFREACDAEFTELEVVVNKFKKSVDAAESKVKGLRQKIGSKEADLRYFKLGQRKEEERVKNYEETGEGEKAQAGHENLKRMRMDLMKRQREIDDMREQVDKIMNPESGVGAEGIRARRRIMDIEDQLTARDEEYNQTVTDLQAKLAEQQEGLAAAQQYYDQSLYLLGEETYRSRIADPALSALYLKIDRAMGRQR